MADSIGFANLPNQVHRKAVKKGFEFNLLVVGESGLGKTTLINSLFKTNLDLRTKKIPGQDKVTLNSQTVEIEERGVKLRLSVVKAEGFGDGLDATNLWTPISDYVERQLEKFFECENGLNRRQITDSRVHCCFYFLNPNGWSLSPIDIAFMRDLHTKVNIIPLIAKADTLSPSEKKERKKSILEEIQFHGISIYSIPEDIDEDPDYRNAVNELKATMPFAVSGSSVTYDVRGKQVLGRSYPWGIHEVENPEHSDFTRLKSLIVTHMQDMREVTHEVHYENYRAQRLAGSKKAPHIMETSIDDDTDSHFDSISQVEVLEKERILKEKEQELARMKELVRQYEEQMRQQQQTKLPSDSDA